MRLHPALDPSLLSTTLPRPPSAFGSTMQLLETVYDAVKLLKFGLNRAGTDMLI
jgi:hypothetical protein